jgi:hemerythrin-like domain-containing protein
MLHTPKLSRMQVTLMEERHRALLALCLELEELARDLEHAIVPASVRPIAAQLEPLVDAAHKLEEETLYPNLEERAGSCFSSLMIAQIKAEHSVDRKAAHELKLTLDAVADGRCRLSLDTVARMTTRLQDYLQRHVAAEQILLDNLVAAAGCQGPDATSPARPESSASPPAGP